MLAIFACVAPFMASGTGLGILFFCGMRYSSILSLTPFLILTLGVDDAFLTIHSWQSVSKRLIKKKNSDSNNYSIEKHLALVIFKYF